MGRQDVNHSKRFKLVSANREAGSARFEYHNTSLRDGFELSARDISLEIKSLEDQVSQDGNVFSSSVKISNLNALRKAHGGLQRPGIGE